MIVNIEREPALSLYYIGAIITEILMRQKEIGISELYESTKSVLDYELHIDFFYYAIDWLFLNSSVQICDGSIIYVN